MDITEYENRRAVVDEALKLVAEATYKWDQENPQQHFTYDQIAVLNGALMELHPGPKLAPGQVWRIIIMRPDNDEVRSGVLTRSLGGELEVNYYDELANGASRMVNAEVSSKSIDLLTCIHDPEDD